VDYSAPPKQYKGMIMSDNVIKSEDVAPKKTKQAKPKKVAPAEVPSGDKSIVFFESGYSYSLSNGFTFTQENRMLELSAEEANRLLALDNFRLPTDEEKQMYYNSLEA
jgi:hypothetical protein